MKLAIMMAGMASGNKIASDPAKLLQQGTKLVQSNPQLSALSDQVRNQLVEAGKGVAVAAMSRQMESLSERIGGRLEGRTGSLRKGRKATHDEPADDGDDAAEESADSAEDPAGERRDDREAPRRRGSLSDRSSPHQRTSPAASSTRRATAETAGKPSAARKSGTTGKPAAAKKASTAKKADSGSSRTSQTSAKSTAGTRRASGTRSSARGGA
jgi:hypothetical protein